eukprot:TRINITY_DN8645_c0_g4_i1.p1 TRINITY_DN8645_c0_g4~~TRINITY_DN8645_c0_g4_i1.p1  ORF type:complete len:838 (-),score=256.72 TRINITY_DN8645_c0_g4_i1:134-2569(-)
MSRGPPKINPIPVVQQKQPSPMLPKQSSLGAISPSKAPPARSVPPTPTSPLPTTTTTTKTTATTPTHATNTSSIPSPTVKAATPKMVSSSTSTPAPSPSSASSSSAASSSTTTPASPGSALAKRPMPPSGPKPSPPKSGSRVHSNTISGTPAPKIDPGSIAKDAMARKPSLTGNLTFSPKSSLKDSHKGVDLSELMTHKGIVKQNRKKLLLQESIQHLTKSLVGDNVQNLTQALSTITFTPQQEMSPLTKPQRDALIAMIADAAEFLEEDRRLKSIVVVQSLLRRWLCRRYRYLTNGDKLVLQIRQNVFRDLYSTESRYLTGLNNLIQNYLVPMRQKGLLKIQDLIALFSNIEAIRELHLNLKEKLLRTNHCWPYIDDFVDVLNGMVPTLKIYGTYVTNFKNAVDTCQRLLQDGSKASIYLNEVQAMQEGYDLTLLLSLPINHISTYERILEPLVLVTPLSHPEYDKINQLFSILQQTSLFIQNALAQADAQAELLSWERKLSSEVPLNLVKAGRIFLKEKIVNEAVVDDKKKSKKISKRTAFIFSDIVYLTKPEKHIFKVKKAFEITDQSTITELPDSGSIKNILEIKAANGVIVKLSYKTPEEKTDLLKDFKQLIEDQMVSRVFMVPFEKVMAREPQRQMPLFLEKCLAFLEASGLKIEGLFRVPGTLTEVNEIKKEFDRGNINSVDLSKYTIHSTCSIVKLWFRELPEPFIPLDLYAKLITAFKNSDKAALVKLIQTDLNKQKYVMLKTLIGFLRKVAEQSESNKMTPFNLAIVFGPAILRPPMDTIEGTLDIPIVNNILQILIENGV